MGDLQPGDLCVIVRDKTWDAHNERKFAQFIGRTVVLLWSYNTTHLRDESYNPYWRVSGLGDSNIRNCSHTVLRKIPPAERHEEETTDEEITV